MDTNDSTLDPTEGASEYSLSRQVHLVERPIGHSRPSDFQVTGIHLAPVAVGEVRVRNEVFSVDPYMRGRMDDTESYVEPFGLGMCMTGRAIGTVVESRADSLPVGARVVHQLGWRDIAQGAASVFQPVRHVPGVDAGAHMDVLGMTGLTAWIGLVRVARVARGDTVFVSAAAGAVGTAAGQFARQLGAAQVIGSAGSPAKVAMLTEECGFDAAFNYRDGDLGDWLAEVAPEGVDVYFDNVGGDHLRAALTALRDHGRVALCGSISTYDLEEPVPGPDNLDLAITKALTLQGYRLGDNLDAYDEFVARVAPWVADGSIVRKVSSFDGVDSAVAAFLSMMRGETTGKTIVRV